jgi:Flp pilus assembly protein TadD
MTPAAAAPPPSATALTESGKGPDGSGRKAPDCKTLFGSDPPPAGFYPGAAWQEVKAGRSSIVRGDLGAAQASFCRAVRWDKSNAEVAMQLAQVLLLHRDGAQALEWAEKAASLDPSSMRAKETLGDALARMGRDEEARTAWLAAARIEANDQRGVRGLVMREVRAADRALKGRELVVAEKYFRRAALLEPRSWSAMVGLSYVLLELGEVKPAVVWAERAVAAAPRNSSVRLALGDALSRAGETARATEAWREATLLDPNNREARKRLRKGS